MSLEHILLGQLRQPSTGYELGKEFDDGAGHFWPAERSQIYPTLKKLEQKGWLTCSEQPSERGPRRKVYATTDAGFEELRKWLTEGPQIGRERLAYIAQVYYLGALDDFEAGLAMIRKMQARWRQSLALFEHIERAVVEESGDWQDLEPCDFFPRASLGTGLHLMRAKLAWCDETIQRLETRVGSAAATPAQEND
ncbi:MAG: hypothetical protein GKS06_05405 [Acidobacteria bacterium]|nr:hypothetical protein [Acidobacteriota bacterium]